MSYAGIERVDYTKGNKGERIKLNYNSDGSPARYRIRITSCRGKEEPEPPVQAWVAIDFEIIESSSDNEELQAGCSAGHAWTVGGQWGHLGFQDLKAFLALALELPPAKAAKIDRSVVLYCTGDDQPLAGKEFDVDVTRKVRGKKSAKPGEPFALVHFKSPKDAI